MDLSHIAHWIQRQGEELLDYHMFDEDSDRDVAEEEHCGCDWTPPPVDDRMPRARPVPDVRRCRALVDGQEVGGVIDVATGVVTLDDPPEPGPFSLCIVWSAELSSAAPACWPACWDVGSRIVSRADWETLQALYRAARGPEGCFQLDELPDALRLPSLPENSPRWARFASETLQGYYFTEGLVALAPVVLIEVQF